MSKKTEQSFNLPTLLTVFRIILVIPLIICFFINTLPAQIITVTCFSIASLTDFIDGRLARKYHQVTIMGTFLDPLADKILINLTFLIFIYVDLMPLWMFIVVLVRDFVVDGIRMMAAHRGKTIASVKSGKLKTLVQMCTIIFILLNIIFQNPTFAIINNILLYIVVFLTIISGTEILLKNWKYLYK